MNRDDKMWLTLAEVKRLTDRTYAPAQRRVLDDRRIPYDQDGAGRPLVLRAYFERKHLGKAISPESVKAPDFSAFPIVS